jgi:antitoxin YefM
MKVINFSDAKKNLRGVLEKVVIDSDYTIIHRKNNKDVVIMSLEHFNGLSETVHLLRTSANAEHIQAAIQQYNTNKVEKHRLIDD